MLLNEGDVEAILNRLGIDYDSRGDELIALCPMHLYRTGRADNNPSWSINIETGVHHCFSCSYAGSLLGLVCDVLEYTDDSGARDFGRASRWIGQYGDIDVEKSAARLEKIKDSYIKSIKPAPMSEARLAVFDEPPQWALDKRGISAEVCEDYTVKWSTLDECWITPVRDPYTQALLGWQEKGEGHRYFKNHPAGLLKSRTLFGLGQCSGVAVVVESPLDVLKMATWGYNGVSTYGASVSKEQIKLLSTFDTIIFAMDNDAAGKRSMKEIRRMCREYGMEYSVFNYGESTAKDIGDMSQYEFEQGLMTSNHCVFGGI